VQNILTKCIGSHNPTIWLRATVQGLQQLESREQVASRRASGRNCWPSRWNGRRYRRREGREPWLES